MPYDYDPGDTGNQWAEKPLSVRLKQIRNQWINLGERQQGMLDNLILSAEFLEAKVRELSAKVDPVEELIKERDQWV